MHMHTLTHAIEYAWPHGHLDPCFLPVVPSGLSVRDFARVVHDLHHLDPATTVQVLSCQPPHNKLAGTLMLLPGDAVQVRRKYKPRPGGGGGGGGGAVDGGSLVDGVFLLPPPPPLPPMPLPPSVASLLPAPKPSTAFVVTLGMDCGWYADLAQATMAGSLALPACRVKAAEPFLAGAACVDLADDRTARLVRRALVPAPAHGPAADAVTATAVGSVAAWAVRGPPPGAPFTPTTVIHVTTLDALADSLPPGARLCTDHLPWLHSDMALPSRTDAPLGQWLLAKDPAVLRLRRACTMAHRVALRCALEAARDSKPNPTPVPSSNKVSVGRQGHGDGAKHQGGHQQQEDPRAGPLPQGGAGVNAGPGVCIRGPRRRRRG
jgi:hypothetical protein